MTLYYAATFILGMMFGAGIVLGLAALFHQCDQVEREAEMLCKHCEDMCK